ncbi:MAG: hypothetical protein AAGJ81_03085 [Verrucomicrobiota bacterium]
MTVVFVGEGGSVGSILTDGKGAATSVAESEMPRNSHSAAEAAAPT